MIPLSFGFHRMSSPCARGATASGGVTFMRAASSLIPSTCFSPACSSLGQTSTSRSPSPLQRTQMRKRGASRSPRFALGVRTFGQTRSTPHCRQCVWSYESRTPSSPCPPCASRHSQRHRHEYGTSYFASALIPTTPRLLDECRCTMPLFLGFATAHRPVLHCSAHPLPSVCARAQGLFQRTQRIHPSTMLF